jgi:hypothetical protein
MSRKSTAINDDYAMERQYEFSQYSREGDSGKRKMSCMDEVFFIVIKIIVRP